MSIRVAHVIVVERVAANKFSVSRHILHGDALGFRLPTGQNRRVNWELASEAAEAATRDLEKGKPGAVIRATHAGFTLFYPGMAPYGQKSIEGGLVTTVESVEEVAVVLEKLLADWEAYAAEHPKDEELVGE